MRKHILVDLILVDNMFVGVCICDHRSEPQETEDRAAEAINETHSIAELIREKQEEELDETLMASFEGGE